VRISTSSVRSSEAFFDGASIPRILPEHNRSVKVSYDIALDRPIRLRGLGQTQCSPGSFDTLRALQQIWQSGNVDRDPSRLVFRQSVHPHSASGLVFEIDVGKRLSATVARIQKLSVDMSSTHQGGVNERRPGIPY
jgi:hypothetical protein